ncbi:MAG TPA: hypothetical protein VFO46_05885 [Candidatus Sulfotelmatobacter sp.]|nr:hypothetical protein [Candidatus Sulfotelmatobacter sp.]
MREETQQQDMCVYCGKPVTPEQYPCKGMPDGRKAHLICYLDHDADEERGRRAPAKTGP